MFIVSTRTSVEKEVRCENTSSLTSATLHTVGHTGDPQIWSLNLLPDSKTPEENCCLSWCTDFSCTLLIITSVMCPQPAPVMSRQ